MTGPEHYKKAEIYLAAVKQCMDDQMSGATDINTFSLAGLSILAAVAQVHATLAQTAMTGDRVRSAEAWRKVGAIE